MITSHKGAVALYYLGERRLLSGEDFLNVVELVEGFDGREVVHVDAQELIADLFEYRVVHPPMRAAPFVGVCRCARC